MLSIMKFPSAVHASDRARDVRRFSGLPRGLPCHLASLRFVEQQAPNRAGGEPLFEVEGGADAEGDLCVELRFPREETVDHFMSYDLFVYGVRLDVLALEARGGRAGSGAMQGGREAREGGVRSVPGVATSGERVACAVDWADTVPWEAPFSRRMEPLLARPWAAHPQRRQRRRSLTALLGPARGLATC